MYYLLQLHKLLLLSVLCLSLIPLLHVPPSQWSKNFEPVTIYPFTSQSGPTITVPEEPINIFNIFFSDDLVQLMVSETNRYAKEVLGNKYDSWQQTTVNEVRAYLGFHILKGINILPSDDDYWKKDSCLYYHPIASRVSRDRFRELGRYFHFIDNSTLPTRDSLTSWGRYGLLLNTCQKNL